MARVLPGGTRRNSSPHVAPRCGGICAFGPPARGSAGCGLHVAPRFVRIYAFGAPARGSAGCGLDREPDPPESLRSRGVSLLPPSGRETTHAASYWKRIGQQVLTQRSIAAPGVFRGVGDYARGARILLK